MFQITSWIFFFLLLRHKTLKNDLRRGHEGESMDIINQTFESWVWWYIILALGT